MVSAEGKENQWDLTREIVCDFETAELQADGTLVASTEGYRSSFRVISCGFTGYTLSGRMVSLFVRGERKVRRILDVFAKAKTPIVAHNLQFEMLVTKCRFRDLNINWHADTMRLMQNYDNGDDRFAFTRISTVDDELDAVERSADDAPTKESKIPYYPGFSLTNCVKRVLSKEHWDHKREAHEWLRANIPECKKGREGMFLNRLPADILERYNVGDTENTMRLYERCTQKFARLKFDWRLDHALFMSSVRRIVDSKIRGVLVDRVRLSEFRGVVVNQISGIESQFKERFANELQLLERQRLISLIRAKPTMKRKKRLLKTLRTNAARYKKDVTFNIGSNKQLASLFVDVLKITPKFFTSHKTNPQPSFKSSMLSQWGEGGAIIRERRKRMLALKQTEALLALTEHDGLWHVDLRAVGTATSRYSGGSH